MRTVHNPSSKVERAASWTESVYSDRGSVAEAVDTWRTPGVNNQGMGLGVVRAALLPGSAYLERATFQTVVAHPVLGFRGVGRPHSESLGLFGAAAEITDYPQNTLLCRLSVVAPHRRRPLHMLRCLPDRHADFGEYAPKDAYPAILSAYFSMLAEGYGTIIDDLTLPGTDGRAIDTITEAGTLTYLGEILDIPVDSMVKITRTTAAGGVQTGGRFPITAVNSGARQLTLGGWTSGSTKGGRVRLWVQVFAHYSLAEFAILRIIMRKIGAARDYRGTNKRRALS